MSKAILLNQFRKKLAAYMANDGELKKIKYIGIGDGGHDPDTEEVKKPNPDATGLNNQLVLKELTDEQIIQEDDFSVTGNCTLTTTELQNKDISEAALYDEDHFCIGIYNFKPKHKETSELYAFSVKLAF